MPEPLLYPGTNLLLADIQNDHFPGGRGRGRGCRTGAGRARRGLRRIGFF